MSDMVTVVPAVASFYLPPFLVGSVNLEDLQRGCDYCCKIGSKDSIAHAELQEGKPEVHSLDL